ncbi:MAG: hypothetical protein ACFFG0_01400 [Candidatus Thorarchaeota archaeon]
MKRVRYFLKAPWQTKHEEVTVEQFIIAKRMAFRSKGLFSLFQDIKADCGFIAPDGTEGWVQYDMGEITVHEMEPKKKIES